MIELSLRLRGRVERETRSDASRHFSSMRSRSRRYSRNRMHAAA
jgi:hypothetical protein